MFHVFQKTFQPVIEVIGYEAPEVLFTCKHPLPLGDCDVRAVIAGVDMKARVQVIETEQNQARGYWLAPEEAVPYLSQLFAPPEKRRSPRFAHTLRVKSPMGFQGWSIDISSQGLRLETQGGLGLGQTVPIQMDLGDAFETRLEVYAGVRWYAPSLTEGWTVAGLEFQNLNPDLPEIQRYTKFLDKLATRQAPLA